MGGALFFSNVIKLRCHALFEDNGQIDPGQRELHLQVHGGKCDIQRAGNGLCDPEHIIDRGGHCGEGEGVRETVPGPQE